MRRVNVAIVGATGAVGRAMLDILADSDLAVDDLYLLASKRSAGIKLPCRDKEYIVSDLAEFDFTRADIALFSAGGDISKIYAPKAAASGCLVVDNTSAFRYDDDVPLVVPEVNASVLADKPARYIIANPNCSTMQLVVALAPLHEAFGLERVIVATYQAVSGAGNKGVSELAAQTAAMVENTVVPAAQTFSSTIAFNCVPHIDVFEENGYTREEMKVQRETRKIMCLPELAVSCTAVRVPVYYGHSEAVHVQCARSVSVAQAREILATAPGLELVDAPDELLYPTALTHAAGENPVFVGRIREDLALPNGLAFWVVADNVRKGAALNTVQIAQTVLEQTRWFV